MNNFSARGSEIRKYSLRFLSRLWDLTLERSLYALLLVTVLFFGGAIYQAYTLFEMFAFLLLGGVLLRKLFYPNVVVSCKALQIFFRPLFFLNVWVFYILLQCLPLPVFLLEAFSPHRVEFYRIFTQGVVGTTPSLSMSLGTYAMRVEVVKLLSYTAIFIFSYLIFSDRKGIRRLLFAVMIIGSIVSFVGLFFNNRAPGEVYGVWSFPQTTAFTPYLHKNQFANYLVMTMAVTFSFLFLSYDRASLPHQSSLRQRALWLVSDDAVLFWVILGLLALQTVAFFQAASRAGLVGCLSVLAYYGFFFVRRIKRKFLLAIYLILFMCGGLALSQSRDMLVKWKRFVDAPRGDLSVQYRLSNWKDAVQIFKEFPWVGIGAGGFSEVFPKYKSLPQGAWQLQSRFYYLENEPLQSLVELGIVGTGFWIMMAFSILKKWDECWTSLSSKTLKWSSLGMVAACLGTFFHSFFDFSTHLPANMALYATLGGVLTRIAYHPNTISQGLEGQPALGFSPQMPALRVWIITLSVLSMFVFGFLFFQWMSEYTYREASNILSQIHSSKKITRKRIEIFQQRVEQTIWWGRGQSRAYHLQGLAYLYWGVLRDANDEDPGPDYKKAEIFLKRALISEPMNARHQESLALLYQLKGEPEKAEGFYRNASLLERQNPYFLYQRAMNLLRLHKASAAYEEFKRTLKLDRGTYLERILKDIENSKNSFSQEEIETLINVKP